MIIHKDSHTDHAITPAQWQFIVETFKDHTSFFIETVELPLELGHVMNGLYGPSCGDGGITEDSVYYAPRPPRTWKSRMTKMPARPTRFVRVIAGPHEETCPRCEGTGMWYGLSIPPDNGPYKCDDCTKGKLQLACILYTAYGVSDKNMPAAPKEPGDIRQQLEELHRKRAGLHDMSPEYKALNDQVIALREKRTEADEFWSTHAIATEVV